MSVCAGQMHKRQTHGQCTLKNPLLYGERSLSRVVWEVSNKQSVYFITLGIYILIFFFFVL